ncbi:MAG: vWA domain-containing protein [Planctomycetota bacterium]
MKSQAKSSNNSVHCQAFSVQQSLGFAGRRFSIGRQRNRRGAMLVLIAIMMIGFMLAVAFSVDIAQMHLARTELRTATDAASKAAAATLAETQSRSQAILRGQQIAAANLVNGDPLLLDANDFDFGRSVELRSGKFQFNPGDTPNNSVMVNGRRTVGSPSGPVPLFFGNLFGVEFFEPQSLAAATYIERDVVLVVDRSGSMRGQKFQDLSNAIDIFTETLNQTPVDEHVGLASYSSQASEDVQMTEDMSEITRGVDSLNVGGFTSISRGMQAGANVMNNGRGEQFVERTLIVMTDGKHNRGVEPSTVAVELAAEGMQIYTITFGSGADRDRMQDVAEIGGGRHYHADNGLELEQVYKEIALTLSTMMTQ